MELNINRGQRTLKGALGISAEKADQLIDNVKNWVKKMTKEDKPETDISDVLKYCASICETLEEYTLMAVHVDRIIEKSMRELHEENCTRCKKEAAEKRERFASAISGAGLQELAPNVFIINL